MVTLRFLNHLRPLDFYEHYDSFTTAAQSGDLNLLQWFPEYKSELLYCADFLFPENIEEWIRKNDDDGWN